MAEPRLMLLDTASLYFRAFYGLPTTLTAADGTPVNAVRGLLDFLARFVTEYRPSHLVCCWDNDWRPGWRVELLPSYKTHRVAGAAPGAVVGAGGRGAMGELAEESPDELTPQVPVIREVLAAIGIAVVGADDHEADDVIGSLSGRDQLPTDVVTGDRDLFQLVDDEAAVRVLYVARGVSRHERVDDAWLAERYGVLGASYADFAVLRGDPSDGIPGVTGVGEKTAARLLSTHGDLAGIEAAARVGELTTGVSGRLAAARDYLAVAPRVVRVRRDLHLGVETDTLALPAAPADPEALDRLAERWSLGSSRTRLVEALAG